MRREYGSGPARTKTSGHGVQGYRFGRILGLLTLAIGRRQEAYGWEFSANEVGATMLSVASFPYGNHLRTAVANEGPAIARGAGSFATWGFRIRGGACPTGCGRFVTLGVPLRGLCLVALRFPMARLAVPNLGHGLCLVNTAYTQTSIFSILGIRRIRTDRHSGNSGWGSMFLCG